MHPMLLQQVNGLFWTEPARKLMHVITAASVAGQKEERRGAVLASLDRRDRPRRDP
jgi:hypothetical protein